MESILSGTRITWTESGAGRMLLLLHGLPFQKSLWTDLIAQLESRFRVVCLDLPGFGGSDLLPGTPSMDAYGDLIGAFLREQSDGSAIVAGHSFGGYVLLNLALREPSSFAGLVLVCSRAIADEPSQAANRLAMAARLATESPLFVAEGMLPRMPGTRNSDPALLKRIREAMEPLRADGIAWAQRAIASRPDCSARLGEIALPSLVVAGLHDAVVPLEESGIVAANLGNGRLSVIEESGHCPMIEKPRETATALLAWAAKAGLAES